MSVVAAVRMMDGTDALVIRSCVNVSGCSTPDNPDVITLVKRSKEPVDLANLQAQLQKNSRERVILRRAPTSSAESRYISRVFGKF